MPRSETEVEMDAFNGESEGGDQCASLSDLVLCHAELATKGRRRSVRLQRHVAPEAYPPRFRGSLG
jgi:hypothetical protein